MINLDLIEKDFLLESIFSNKPDEEQEFIFFNKEYLNKKTIDKKSVINKLTNILETKKDVISNQFKKKLKISSYFLKKAGVYNDSKRASKIIVKNINKKLIKLQHNLSSKNIILNLRDTIYNEFNSLENIVYSISKKSKEQYYSIGDKIDKIDIILFISFYIICVTLYELLMIITQNPALSILITSMVGILSSYRFLKRISNKYDIHKEQVESFFLWLRSILGIIMGLFITVFSSWYGILFIVANMIMLYGDSSESKKTQINTYIVSLFIYLFAYFNIIKPQNLWFSIHKSVNFKDLEYEDVENFYKKGIEKNGMFSM
jgi:hypothetical protein